MLQMLTAMLIGANVVLIALQFFSLRALKMSQLKLDEAFKAKPDLDRKVLELGDKVSSLSIRMDRK